MITITGIFPELTAAILQCETTGRGDPRCLRI